MSVSKQKLRGKLLNKCINNVTFMIYAKFKLTTI